MPRGCFERKREREREGGVRVGPETWFEEKGVETTK